MQRVPLENVYLQVCASGIGEKGISDQSEALSPAKFLELTPDPPDKSSVDFAEAALRELGALDPEDKLDGLTPLGRHLAALPCHPRLGKILVLGCLLGVPGPCLSICAAMSVRNPMLTTQDTAKRANWQTARNEMVAEIGTRSDHCAWAHIVQEWRFGDMKQRELCRKLGLSFERMCSSMFERKHLSESLVQVGLLPASFKDDELDSKDKMPDWNLVRAAVVGGLYPNILHAQRRHSSGRYQTGSFGDKAKFLTYQMLQRNTAGREAWPKTVNLHPNSLMFGHDQFHCPWLAFYTIQQTTKLYAYDVSEASPFSLLLFGGEPEYNECTHTLQILAALDGDTAVHLVLEALKQRPRLAPAVVGFACPALTYAPARAMAERRCWGVLTQVPGAEGEGFGVISSPEIEATFGAEVAVSREQLGGFQVGQELSFSCALDAENKPRAFELLPGGWTGPLAPAPAGLGAALSAVPMSSAFGGSARCAWQRWVGGFASFRCRGGKQLVPLLQAARKGIQDVLEHKLEDVKWDVTTSKELQMCVQLLRCNGLGFRKPDPADFVRLSDSQVKEFDESVNETAFMMKKASGMKQRALVPKKLARLQTFLSQHRTVA
ncbi:unnamed protein product [Effrenium voratum]|uniref:Helicase-associated domain-containing protein n=1 Tax=Effrenium voratum TaxID=2562239 RepID=A0AA36JRQ4_9DINO|nr:unnamed protein product [Effrenium voratum]